jgi:large subunit ribosomal protein L15
VVNLSVLDKLDAGTKVTPELLRDKGLLRNPANPVKVLGKGELKKKLMVAVHKVSATAKSAIEKAGGSVEVKEK